MARPIWTGAVSFGLVSIPVKLYSATQDKSVRFHQIDSRTGSRVRQKRVSEADGSEVPYDKIVKGYELSSGAYVTITPDELVSLDPKSSRAIDLVRFVDQASIDPIFYDSAYLLGPDPAAPKPYALLRRAMVDADKVAIGTFVMRGKERLCALRPGDDDRSLLKPYFLLTNKPVMARLAAESADDRIRPEAPAPLAHLPRAIRQMHAVKPEPLDEKRVALDHQRDVAGMGDLAQRVGRGNDARFLRRRHVQPHTGDRGGVEGACEKVAKARALGVGRGDEIELRQIGRFVGHESPPYAPPASSACRGRGEAGGGASILRHCQKRGRWRNPPASGHEDAWEGRATSGNDGLAPPSAPRSVFPEVICCSRKHTGLFR